MTSRVLKQQQENQQAMNSSQHLLSQRSTSNLNSNSAIRANPLQTGASSSANPSFLAKQIDISTAGGVQYSRNMRSGANSSHGNNATQGFNSSLLSPPQILNNYQDNRVSHISNGVPSSTQSATRDNPVIFFDQHQQQNRSFLSHSPYAESNNHMDRQLKSAKNLDMPRAYQPGAAPTLDKQQLAPGQIPVKRPNTTQGNIQNGVIRPMSAAISSPMQQQIYFDEEKARLEQEVQKNYQKATNLTLQYQQQQYISRQQHARHNPDMMPLQMSQFQSMRGSTDNSGQSIIAAAQQLNQAQQMLRQQQQQMTQSMKPPTGQSTNPFNKGMPPQPYKIRFKNTPDSQIGPASQRGLAGLGDQVGPGTYQLLQNIAPIFSFKILTIIIYNTVA